MKNFKVLLKYSLKPKLVGKKQVLSFIGLILLPFLLIAIGGHFALGAFEEEQGLFDLDLAEQIYIYPQDELAEQTKSLFSSPQVIDNVDDIEGLFAQTEEDYHMLINLETNEVITDFDVSYQDTLLLNNALGNIKLSSVVNNLGSEEQAKVAKAQTSPEYSNITGEDNDNSGFLYALSFINTLAIYFIIVFGFQILGNEIFEEKSSRAMEVIITNTKPHVHMLTKIVSVLVFLVALIGSILIGLALGLVVLTYMNPDTIGIAAEVIIEMLKSLSIQVDYTLVIFIILMFVSGVFAILLYQILAAMIAAMSTSYEDYQKANGPLVIFLMIPYFVSLFEIGNLSQFLVYVPFFTPYFAPSLYLSQDMTLIVFGVCVLIQVVSTLILYRLTAPVYREGLLNYSTSSFKEIIKRSYRR